MSADLSHPVAQLADEVKFYWLLLQTSVRLDRTWHANLAARHYEAESEALSIGRCVVAGARSVDSPADLREFLVEKIRNALPRMSEQVSQAALPAHTRTIIRSEIEQVTEITALLVRGVDVRSCRCTAALGARRQLAQRLVGEKHARQFVDAASELTKLACAEAARRLAACISACFEIEADEAHVRQRIH